MSRTDGILDWIPDAVVVVDADGTVESMNAAAEKLTGWTREDARGITCSEVLPLTDAAGIAVSVCAPDLKITTGTPERDYLITRANGTARWVAVRAAFKRDPAGRLDRTILSIRDIGRRRRLELARADLVATVSHEIRSPLTSVKGFTSTLLHRWDRFPDEQKKIMLETINHDADRVTRLLTELLDVSRMEAGRLELRRQESDISEIARKVVDRLAARTDLEGFTFETRFAEEFPRVVLDPNKIEQVLINLCENAVKYAAGQIAVVGEDFGDHVIVRVSDQGEGIDAKHVPHIFTKFYRRGAGERHSGTGLGLYICKGIVEAHGGTIWVERTGPDGTTFAFTVPKGDG